VSYILKEILPLLSELFKTFIPNKLTGNAHSRLSKKVKFIIDNTIHRCRRPMSNQSLLYNGHYKTHGWLSQIIVDYDGLIIAYKTMIPGKVHDSLSATYNKLFKSIVKNNLALGDPGFQGVGYVMVGYKKKR